MILWDKNSACEVQFGFNVNLSLNLLCDKTHGELEHSTFNTRIGILWLVSALICKKIFDIPTN